MRIQQKVIIERKPGWDSWEAWQRHMRAQVETMPDSKPQFNIDHEAGAFDMDVLTIVEGEPTFLILKVDVKNESVRAECGTASNCHMVVGFSNPKSQPPIDTALKNAAGRIKKSQTPTKPQREWFLLAIKKLRAGQAAWEKEKHDQIISMRLV